MGLLLEAFYSPEGYKVYTSVFQMAVSEYFGFHRDLQWLDLVNLNRLESYVSEASSMVMKSIPNFFELVVAFATEPIAPFDRGQRYIAATSTIDSEPERCGSVGDSEQAELGHLTESIDKSILALISSFHVSGLTLVLRCERECGRRFGSRLIADL
jgi:hypothetical protein